MEEQMFGKIGAGDRIRTGDINLGKVALYQLSYSREANCKSHQANVIHANVIHRPRRTLLSRA
jgi:hypothetical protein